MSDTKAVEQRIEEIRNRLAGITPGPWEVETDDACVWHLGSGGTICTVNFDHQTGDHQPGEDQAFIANAPSDIGFLLDQLSSIPAQIKAAVQAERDNQWNGLDEFIDAMQAGDNDDGARLRAAWDLCDVLTAAIRARGDAPSTPNQSEQ